MNPDSPLPTRLKAGSPGLGAGSESEIEQRAAELALSDGRDAYTDADLARASEELGGGTPDVTAPEVDPTLEQVTAWDDPPEQAGHRVEPIPLDDELNVSEQLIQSGLEEADHDIRVATEEEAADS